MTPPRRPAWSLHSNTRERTKAEKPVFLFNGQKPKPPNESWWTKHSQPTSPQDTFYAELATRCAVSPPSAQRKEP